MVELAVLIACNQVNGNSVRPMQDGGFWVNESSRIMVVAERKKDSFGY